MSKRNTYKEGDYLVVCDYTGFTKYASECVMTWDGRFVWKKVWEGRHPQDFVRSRGADNQTVPIPRPRGEDVEIEATEEVAYVDGNGVTHYVIPNAANPEDL